MIMDLRFSSGLPSLDNVLQGILKGDNVVFQSDNFNDYLFFANKFAHWCNQNKKNLIYFRFAEHQPVLTDRNICKEVNVSPKHGFEQFINHIFNVIEINGVGACYVFDCLSELSVEWYSDRMLANFFRLTCPYLYKLDTVAYFLLLKNKSSKFATNVIQQTAQVVIDVFNVENKKYLLPVKVENRFSPTLYMLHSCENETFTPILSSHQVSRILSSVHHKWGNISQKRDDIWTQIFSNATQLQEQEVWSNLRDENYRKAQKHLIRMMISRDEKLSKLCEEYFQLSDLVSIGRRMIGTGLIGGKSTGMLLARNIIKKNSPHIHKLLENHDSFYLGSDVFYTYLVENDCWWDRKQLIKSKKISDASAIREKLLHGTLPNEIIEQLKEILDYFGQSPIIVRSSSLLEDAYGNAFSGKYESFFLPNQGTPKERLNSLLSAIKHIYASTMNEDALYYRLERGLFDKDEQMALLIQRVSGQFIENFYFPHCAGVAYYYDPFVWNSRIKPEDGVMRIVFGLGTRAVEQHSGDYTRIVALGEPSLRPEKNLDELIKYSQKFMDIINISENKLQTEQISNILPLLPDRIKELLSEEDTEAEKRAMSLGIKIQPMLFLTFERLLSDSDFVQNIKSILSILHQAYKYPVDIEFTANFSDSQTYTINLLQCRPFQTPVKALSINQDIDKIPNEKLLIRSAGPIIGQNSIKKVFRIIYVVPSAYSSLSQSEKFSVARIIGSINNLDESLKHKILLIGPGRWGSKMPELGVPVSFAEIKNCAALCELSVMHEALTPDLSFGTHFFNDLVEFQITYIAIMQDTYSVFSEQKILSGKNFLSQLIPESAKFANVIHIFDCPKNEPFTLFVDSINQKVALTL